MRLVRSVLETGEVDSTEIRHRIGSGVLGEADLFVVFVEDLHVEPEALEFLDENLERLRNARSLDLLTLDDRFIGLDSTHDIVRLDGEKLLKDVRRAVRFERPDLHLTEALAAELGLTAQRLLRDEAVGSGRPGVDLVLDKVVELEHVDIADRDVTVESLARSPVAERDFAVLGQTGQAQFLADLLLRGTVEYGRGGLQATLVERPTEVCLEDLADVHSTRHTEWIEDDVDRRAVGQVRHVLHRQDLCDDALVAVATGHLVPDADLALLGHGDPDQAVDAWHELVALFAAEDADVYDLATLAVRQAQARVFHLAGLLAEDRAEESLLSGQLGFALGCDLADQDVARLNLGTDVDDAFLVQVFE